MHVIIGGFGRVGRHLAHMLESEGHSVAVIDRNAAVFAEYGEEIRGRKLTGEVFDRETLILAGIEKADAFAAVTAGDNSNIVAARVARERFNVPVVVARIFDPRRATIYEKFGIPTISAVRWAGNKMLTMILEPTVRIERVYGSGEIITVQAVATEDMIDKPLSEVEQRDKWQVTAVVRDRLAMLPAPSLSISEGDQLYLTANRDNIDELKRLFGIE